MKKTTKTAAKKPSTKTPATPSKALAKVSSAPANIDSLLEEDAGAGQENMDRNDFSVPRLTILQDLSPQVKKTETAFIKGAEVGMICDTISGNLFDSEKGILVLPVSYRRAYIEWRDRKKGGGFVADHGSDGDIVNSCTRDDKGRLTHENGNQISVVGEYFIFLIDENGGHTPYVLSMAGSQLKKARKWNTIINQLRIPRPSGGGTFCPAMFARSYQLTTVPERNDQGSWFGWAIKPSEFTLDIEGGAEIYVAAREFRKSVMEGKVAASAPSEHEAGSSNSEHDSPM